VLESTIAANDWLHHNGMMVWVAGRGAWAPLPLGVATQASGLAPATALLVKQDLDSARRGLNLETDLHMAYLVTPVDQRVAVLDERGRPAPEWPAYDARFGQLGAPHKAVAALVGYDQECRQWLASMALGGKLHEERKKTAAHARTCRRLYAALILQDVLSEARGRARSTRCSGSGARGPAGAPGPAWRPRRSGLTRAPPLGRCHKDAPA